MPRSSKFVRARHHLSSTQIDERIKALNEEPTNNTSGYYVIEPDVVTVIPAVRSDLDLTVDDPTLIGKDTSGLFDSGGNSLSEMPPGDTSYILGPMVSVYFPDGDYSAIGYIQKDTRKVINLARIPGTVGGWGVDGNVEGFTSYSQLTLEQALWYRDKLINGNTSPYRVFYIGVFEQLNSEPSVTDPSTGVNVDEYGRWQGQIVNQGEILEPERTEVTPGKKGPDPDMPPGIANPMLSVIQGQIVDIIRGSLSGAVPGGVVIDNLLKLKKNVPALDYSVDIAISVLQNKPVVYDQSDLDPRHINSLIRNINPNQIGTNIPINKEEIPYADDNFITDSQGNVRERAKFPMKPDGTIYNSEEIRQNPDLLAQANDWMKDQQENPNNTSPMSSNDPGFAGIGNPLHVAGQAQGQIVVPQDGSEPYFKYEDHAYHNTQSDDPGEVPDPIKKLLSNVVHSGSGYGKNTGGMSGYPSSIRGDVIKKFRVPISKLPPNVQNEIKSQMNRSEGLNYRHKKIINEIKKPYVLPEVKKEKIKHRPKVIKSIEDKTRVVGADLMKQAEVPTSFKRIEDTMWKKQERKQNTRFSQERKNMILDSVGTSDHAWKWMTEKNHTKSSNSMYENFSGGQKNQIISKKKIGNDYIIKMYNEEGKVETVTQSVLNERLHKKYELHEQETLNAPNDPLIKRVKNKLSLEIDYPDKPAKMGYPNNPPLPLGQDGYHAEYGNRQDYYKRLDMHSADTMSNPLTGNKKIDDKVLDQTTSTQVNKLIAKIRKKKSKINTSLENQ